MQLRNRWPGAAQIPLCDPWFSVYGQTSKSIQYDSVSDLRLCNKYPMKLAEAILQNETTTNDNWKDHRLLYVVWFASYADPSGWTCSTLFITGGDKLCPCRPNDFGSAHWRNATNCVTFEELQKHGCTHVSMWKLHSSCFGQENERLELSCLQDW